MVTCADDPRHPGAGRARLRAERPPVYTYGEAADADLRLSEMRLVGAAACATWPHCDGEPLGEITLPVPGRHLGLNSAAAVLTALQAGPAAGSRRSRRWPSFPGVRRRFELKGIADGVRVYDEYAYHPTSMTRRAADAARGGRRRAG